MSNTIQQLEERIAQLTDLVKSGEETISSIKETLKLAEQERDRLADQRTESEPKFKRADRDSVYFSITSALYNKGKMQVECHCENNNYRDDAYYRNNNYFHTDKRAQEIADKINFLLKLERLHGTFCPDYVPDWNDRYETKFSIHYDIYKEKYMIQPYTIMKYETNIYFPSSEIAQKVCDILNKELEEISNG